MREFEEVHHLIRNKIWERKLAWFPNIILMILEFHLILNSDFRIEKKGLLMNINCKH